MLRTSKLLYQELDAFVVAFQNARSNKLDGVSSGPTDYPAGTSSTPDSLATSESFADSPTRFGKRATPLETELRLVARVKLNVETIEEEEAMEHGLGLRTPDSEVRP